MKAFSNFQNIMSLPTVQQQHRAWLSAYEGCFFSKAENKKHMMKWATDKQYYYDCKFSPDINTISRLKSRVIIEFDDKEVSLIPEHLEQVRKTLTSHGWGYIRSSHGGKSDYFWVEFDRELTTGEAKSFLKWIAPEGSVIDLNFCSDKKVYPVLFAPHWKYSDQREIPVLFVHGEIIDYDSLSIKSFEIEGAYHSSTGSDGFKYKTFIKKSVEPRGWAKSLNIISLADKWNFHNCPSCNNPLLFDDVPGWFHCPDWCVKGGIKVFASLYIKSKSKVLEVNL